jgi:NADH:ubiquinone oxidoreductase subunit H
MRVSASAGLGAAVIETATLTAMKLAAEIVAVVVLIVPLAVVLYLFVWAARKDGEEDRALQRRLGIRRMTRLGR